LSAKTLDLLWKLPEITQAKCFTFTQFFVNLGGSFQMLYFVFHVNEKSRVQYVG